MKNTDYIFPLMTIHENTILYFSFFIIHFSFKFTALPRTQA